jgi:hypothetical protein
MSKAHQRTMWKLGLPLVVILFGWGCYHFGYVRGYVDALAWAKGVVWD